MKRVRFCTVNAGAPEALEDPGPLEPAAEEDAAEDDPDPAAPDEDTRCDDEASDDVASDDASREEESELVEDEETGGLTLEEGDSEEDPVWLDRALDEVSPKVEDEAPPLEEPRVVSAGPHWPSVHTRPRTQSESDPHPSVSLHPLPHSRMKTAVAHTHDFMASPKGVTPSCVPMQEEVDLGSSIFHGRQKGDAGIPAHAD